MAVPIQTNKLIYKLNYDEIDKKFDIFMVQTSKQKFDRGAYILDIPTMDRNIKGVRFEDGKCFYVLMEKNYKNKYLLRQAIDKAPDTDTISFSQRASSDTEDYIILQLLLNSLGSASHDLLRFNNITGHFYYFHPQWIIPNMLFRLIILSGEKCPMTKKRLIFNVNWTDIKIE